MPRQSWTGTAREGFLASLSLPFLTQIVLHKQALYQGTPCLVGLLMGIIAYVEVHMDTSKGKIVPLPPRILICWLGWIGSWMFHISYQSRGVLSMKSDEKCGFCGRTLNRSEEGN